MKKVLILLAFMAMFCFGQDMTLQQAEKECYDGNYAICAALASTYYFGNDEFYVVSDYNEALRYGKIACDGDIYIGCKIVGNLYYFGRSLEGVDYEKAFNYYNKSCNNNVSHSCGMIGYMYMEGQGVKLDYSKAFEYSKKGCDGEIAQFCHNLGVLYYRGQDMSKTKEYYKKACDLGNQRSCVAYAVIPIGGKLNR